MTSLRDRRRGSDVMAFDPGDVTRGVVEAYLFRVRLSCWVFEGWGVFCAGSPLLVDRSMFIGFSGFVGVGLSVCKCDWVCVGVLGFIGTHVCHRCCWLILGRFLKVELRGCSRSRVGVSRVHVCQLFRNVIRW